MNDAVRISTGTLLTTADLAARPDFRVGLAAVSPSARTIAGPGGRADVEPRVMQVLVVLADAAGQVVTREFLFQRCWGGVYVGDDSLNRTIGAIRKLAAEIGAGSFEIETIPRTGYRLLGEIAALPAQAEPADQSSRPTAISRRALIGSAAGVAIAGSAGLAIWRMRSNDDQSFDRLLRLGVESLEYGDASTEPARYLRQAVAMRPNDAQAQGLLAFALVSNASNVNKPSSNTPIAEAQQAVDASLQLDPDQAEAKLAKIELDRTTLDLGATEDALRAVLASSPGDIFAMRMLWNLLQCAGRSREALALVQRAIALKPLAAANNYPLAQLLWIVDRTAEADRVIDRAMQYWPAHPFVRFARFTIFAFAGRPNAALAMLDDGKLRPQSFRPESVALWRISLAALDDPSPVNVEKARTANRNAAKRNPALSSQAVLTLSALGQVDPAFEIANDLLVFQLPPAARFEPSTRKPGATSTAWRFTPWLFTPPAAALRADPRFAALAEGIGLTAYWDARHVRPDYQLFG